MERDDVEGAKAAAQYFLSLYPYAYNTGDLTEWKAMSHPDCVFCASVIENVEALHAQGGYEIGGDLTFESVTGSDPVDGNAFFGVDVTVIQGPGVKYGVSGAEIETFDGERAMAYFALAPSSETTWLVREVTIEGLP